MRSAKEYENDIGDLLDVFFAGFNTVGIRIRKSLKYRSERGYRSYSPMIDITVGPFSETRGIQLWEEYDNLVNFSRHLIDDMLVNFRANYENFGEGYFSAEERMLPTNYMDFLSENRNSNWNARCLMAIEVEHSGGRKHLLGDMINASVSGRIAVLVGLDEDRYQTFMRHLEYLAYTVDAKKIKFNSKNILVLKSEQLEEALLTNLPERL
jgi:hypothetical protein